ncbi:MAG: hypothetical protein WCV73_05180 [Patescibacteria group bacterium]|jgi:hypothetical protein
MEFKKLINDFTSNTSALKEFIKLQEKYNAEEDRIIKDNPIIIIPKAINFLQKKIDTGDIKGEKLKKAKKDLLELKKLAKNFFKYKIEDQKVVQIESKNTLIHRKVRDTLKALKINTLGRRFVVSSTLINLLCIFEKLFRDLVLFRVNQDPSCIKIEEDKITYKQLNKINNVEEAKNLLITDYIENMFRSQAKDVWFKTLGEIYNFKVEFFENCKREFVEIIERRNIQTHNDGKVNNQYLNNVDPTLITKFKAEKNEKLLTDNDYLLSAIDIIEVIGICLIIKAWKKTNETDQKRAEFINAYVVYPRLKEKRNYVAKNVADFIMRDKDAEEITRDMAKINYWLAIKQDDKFSEIKNEIEKIDISSKPRLIQLGIFALKNDQDNFFDLLKTMLGTKEIDLETYYEFPIFEEMKQTQKSKKMFPLNAKTKTKRIIKKRTKKTKKLTKKRTGN